MSKGVRTHSSGSSGLLSRFVSLAVFLITFKWLQHFRIVSLEARRLTSLLFHGTKTWLIMLGRLLVYVIIMMPGWYELLRYWLFDDKILRNIEYGKGSLSRNVLDVYLPNGSLRWNSSRGEEGFSKGSPVVIFVGGGVWIIGNKLWSALIARSLASMGYLVIVPDYRNFPQGTIEDMCEDLTSSLQWAVENCWHYGGDKNHVILAGQSAGAHIVLCSVLDLFEGKKRRGSGRDLNFSEVAPPSRIPQQVNEHEQEHQHKHEYEHGSRVFHYGGADEGYLEVDSRVPARSGGSEGHSINESLIHSQQGEAGTYADLSQCLDNTEITESGTAAGAAPDTATVLQPASPGFFSRIYSGMRGLSTPSPPRSRSRSRPTQSAPIPIPGAGNTGNRDSDSVSFGSVLNPGHTLSQDRAPSSSPFSVSFERERDSSLAYMSPLTSSVVTAADESFMSASLSQRSLRASFDLGLGAEVNGLELTSLSLTARDMNNTSRGSGSDDGHEGGSLLKPARGSSSSGGAGDCDSGSSDSGSGSGEDSDGENDTWRECRTPAGRSTGRTSDKDKEDYKDRGEDEDEDGEGGGGSTKPTTPYSSVLSRSASSDGLDTDYIYFVSSSPHRGSGASSVDDGDEVTMRESSQGEQGGQQQEETEAERALREALLASVKQLVLLNGPYDLCTLQSHLHRRGLDSSILRWIFGDFSHFSPTLRIKALAARIKLNREQGRGQGQAPSWEAFPPVGLFSCSEDKSIPLEQGRELLGALREVSYHLHDAGAGAGTDGTGEGEGEGDGDGDGEGRLGACLVEYADQIHTSLVVEGPLEGDSTLPRDFDAMVQLVHECGARALCTFTPDSSKGSGGSKMKTARATRSRGRDRDRDRERERERREPPAVHPWVVAIAKRVNPF